MLILTRKEGQLIEITGPGGDKIIITLVECSNTKARIGIDAPLTFDILRDDAKKREA